MSYNFIWLLFPQGTISRCLNIKQTAPASAGAVCVVIPTMSKEYGSLRKYRQHLSDRGDFSNPSEGSFENLLGANDVNFIRSGYPDYIILDSGGDIIGFVEVKPNGKSKLRPNQVRFQRMCKRYGIPFYLWVDGSPLPFIYDGNSLAQVGLAK